MKPKPDMIEIELVVNDEDNDFLTAMGFVSKPAIETPLVYFNRDKENYTFGKEIEEGVIVSPALIPEKRIYRFDPYTNEEYYVYFSRDTVKKLSQNFLISGNHINTTEQHENPIKGVHLIYSWLVENQQDQAITKYGFKVPDGTWMVMYKIKNDSIKEKIKNGEITGISVEAWLSEKFDNSSDKESKEKKILDEIIKLLENM